MHGACRRDLRGFPKPAGQIASRGGRFVPRCRPGRQERRARVARSTRPMALPLHDTGGMRDPREKVDLARLDAEAAVRRLRGLARETAKHRTVGNVHDLRVLSRRLRSELWLVPKKRRKDHFRKARRRLRHLGKVLGKERMYDVAIRDGERFRRKVGNLRRDRRAARDAVRKLLRRRWRKGSFSGVEEALRDLDRVPRPSLVPRLERLRADLKKAARHAARSDRARHRLRLALKKARYVLDLFHRPVPTLEALQKRLGRWHDYVVLIELTGRSRRVAAARDDQWKRAARCAPRAILDALRALRALERALGAEAALKTPASEEGSRLPRRKRRSPRRPSPRAPTPVSRAARARAPCGRASCG